MKRLAYSAIVLALAVPGLALLALMATGMWLGCVVGLLRDIWH